MRKKDLNLARAQRRKVLRLLKRIGMPYDVKREVNVENYQWDGSSLAVKNLDPAMILHELGHWLVATETRDKPEYGIGTPPFLTHDAKFAEKVRDPFSFQISNQDGVAEAVVGEENCAYILGICYMEALGLDWRDTITRHRVLHDVDLLILGGWWPYDEFWCVIDHLNKSGLLDGNRPIKGLRHRKCISS